MTLHDVVAHHMSVISVQSSTAEYRLPDLPEAARGEFRSISDQARRSLTEMRRLLVVLRSEDDTKLLAPQPGLSRLPVLAESMAAAGTTVRLAVPPLPERLPEAVSLTGYRIVQEALSNVVRHASGADTTVEVAFRPDELTIRVANQPPPPTASQSPEPTGAGAGLAGMRERLRLLGGNLVAQATPTGGFTVTANLPIAGETSSQERVNDDHGSDRR